MLKGWHFFFLMKVKLLKAPEEEDNFDVVKSGRYFILLLGRGIALTWDQNMGITVILKEHYRVSRLLCWLELR